MHFLKALIRDTRGAALMETALVTPPLLLMGLGAIELASNVAARKNVNELAYMIADNASRINEESSTGSGLIRESDINDVFLGAQLQSGSLDLQNNGRVIITSLERNKEGGQWVRWQRCFGKSAFSPAYPESTGITGKDFPGMQFGEQLIKAQANDAVMVVEIAYDYKPIVPAAWADYSVQRFTVAYAMNVRDKRDFSRIGKDAPVLRCRS